MSLYYLLLAYLDSAIMIILYVVVLNYVLLLRAVGSCLIVVGLSTLRYDLPADRPCGHPRNKIDACQTGLDKRGSSKMPENRS